MLVSSLVIAVSAETGSLRFAVRLIKKFWLIRTSLTLALSLSSRFDDVFLYSGFARDLFDKFCHLGRGGRLRDVATKVGVQSGPSKSHLIEFVPYVCGSSVTHDLLYEMAGGLA